MSERGLPPPDMLWDRSVEGFRSPVHRRLIGRNLWPPNSTDILDMLPTALRWLPRDNGIAWLPFGAAGAQLAFFGHEPNWSAVELSATTHSQTYSQNTAATA